jgi:hypothetical protein
MRPLGYVLLVFNLLATGGFAYLAIQDWKGRQTITAAGLRHVLVPNGLPLEGGPEQIPARVQPGSDGYSDFAATEIPFRVPMAGGYVNETVSPEFLHVYFSTAGGGPSGGGSVTPDEALAGTTPVSSQINEVRRVRGIVRGAIDRETDNKVALIESYLIHQPESYEERAEIQALVRAGNAAELDRRLMAKFDQVLNPPQPTPNVAEVKPTPEDTGHKAKLPAGSTAEDRDKAAAEDLAALDKRLKEGARVRGAASHDETERRGRLAHLLVHLGRSANWQKRVAMVVGLRQYVKAVVAQTVRLGMMATRVDRQMLDDDDAFLAEYDLLEALARQRTLMVRDMADTRAKLTDQQTKDQDFVNQRQTQLNTLTAQLRAVKAEVDDLLRRQEISEQALFKVQRDVGDTLDEIYKLEADLFREERKRFGVKD